MIRRDLPGVLVAAESLLCTDDPVYVVVTLILGVAMFVIAWLTGYGASAMIGSRRDDRYSPWRFAPLRAVVIAVPAIVSLVAMLALLVVVQEELEDALSCV
jgi:hypothetical protein